MVMGRWPVQRDDRDVTTCSQCHTHIAVRSLTAPCICPRCKARIDPLDGQPWGTPRFGHVSIVLSAAVPAGGGVVYDTTTERVIGHLHFDLAATEAAIQEAQDADDSRPPE